MTQQTLQPDAGFRFRSLVLTRTKRPGILVWLALIFALYCLAGSIFLPRWTLPRLEKELSDVFGTDCIIGGLRVNPLTLQITARDIVIPYPEATAQSAGRDFIRLKRLQVRAALSSFTSKTLVIDELRFLGPEIHITRYKDGSLSPQHIFAATDKEEPEAGASTDEDAPASGDDLFPTVIRNLALENGTLTIKDTIHDASYTITGINLSVPFASTLASDRDLALTPKLSAVVGGKPVTITGEVRPFARVQQTVFTLRARELDLSELRAFIAPYTHLTLQSGKLHTALTLRFDLNPEKAFDFSLAGTVEITDLALADKNNTVFKAAHAVVDMENVILGPRRVLINDAVLENPEIAIRRLKNGSIDWSGFFFLPDDAVRSEVHFTTGEGAKIPKPDAAPAGKTEENAAHGLPLQLVVHKVRVTGGKLAWHDAVPESPVSYGAENITATFTDVNTEKDGHAAFTLDFKLADDKASFTASGTMTMSPLRIDAAVGAKDVPIAPFSGYISENLGLMANRGTCSASGDLSFRDAPERTARLARGNASLSSLQLATKETRTPFLHLQHIEAANVSADFTRQSVHIGTVTGSGIALDLVRNEHGELLLPDPAHDANPQQKSASPAGTGAQRPATPAPSSWNVNVNAVNITKSQISLADTSLRNHAALSLTDLSIAGSDFATHDKKRWRVTASGKPGNRGVLTLAARGNLNPLRLTFSGKMDKVDLRPLSPYLMEHSQLALLEGTLGGDFSGTARRIPGRMRGGEFAINGNLGLYGVSLVHGQRELGGWGRLWVEQFAYSTRSSKGRHLSIASVALNGPRLSVTIDKNGVHSIQKALAPPEDPQTETASQDAAPPPELETNQAKPSGLADIFTTCAIDAIRITNGQANYRDMRVTPPYALKVESIQAAAGNLSLDPDQESPLTASLRVNGSPVAASGTMTSLLTKPSGRGVVTVRDLDLARFTQYSEKYLGYPVQHGVLTADITASLDERKIDMHNSILIRGLDLGRKTASPHAPDIPLATVVSILSDSNGDIQLDLPVSGTLGDPEFALGGIVARLIGNIVVRTISSPITVLNTLLSGVTGLFTRRSLADVTIVFPVGSSTLDKTARANLEKLGKELREYPSVTLHVTGTADRAEKNALVDAWVEKSLRAMKYDALPPELKAKTSPDKVTINRRRNAQEYTDLLFAFYKSMPFVKGSEDPAVNSPQSTSSIMRILRVRKEITDEQLVLLAGARARAVQAALSRESDDVSLRIRLQPSVIEDSKDGESRVASFALISAGQ